MLALFGGFVYAGLLPLAYFLGASALGLSACLGIYLGLTLALSAVLYVCCAGAARPCSRLCNKKERV